MSRRVGAQHASLLFRAKVRKFQRVTIPRAQPSARIFEKICLSEGFLEASAGVSSKVLWGSAGSTEFSKGSDPVLVTLGNCWRRDSGTELLVVAALPNANTDCCGFGGKLPTFNQ